MPRIISKLTKKSTPERSPIKKGAKLSHRQKFDPEKKSRFLELIREGKTNQAAAAEIGLTYCTIWLHRRAYSQFAAECIQAAKDGEAVRNDCVEDALYEAAISGNTTAIQVWLYNRLPDRWADKRQMKTEVTGEGGKPLRIVYEKVASGNTETTQV